MWTEAAVDQTTLCNYKKKTPISLILAIFTNYLVIWHNLLVIKNRFELKPSVNRECKHIKSNFVHGCIHGHGQLRAIGDLVCGSG